MRNRSLFVSALLMASTTACMAGSPPKQWDYDGEFHDAISAADRVVVRPNGVKDGQPIEGKKVLFEVTNAREIREIADHIEFKSPQRISSCFCYGDPTLDWYRGGKKLACAAVKHGGVLHWKGFRGDVQFTQKSATWIVAWLEKHGVALPKKQLEATRLSEAIEREARLVLRRLIPAGFLDAVKRAEADAGESPASDYLNRRDKLVDEYTRAAFKGRKEMYTALFRLMGCLPMRWDSRYMPEQDEAYAFLIRAPRDELDVAFQSASRSKDKLERQGAARVVFSQHYMTVHEKTDADISRWMVMLADTAYADPFPENRRLVLHRLVEDINAPALAVLERATSDPDQTVRRKAIEAIRVRGGRKAIEILRRVAAGKIQPRDSTEMPTDYGKGTGVSFNTHGMASEEYDDPDRDAAARAILGTRR